MKEESEKAGLKLNFQKLRSWHLVPSLHGKQKGEKYKQWQTLFSWAPESPQTVTAAIKIKDATHGKERYNKPQQCIKKQRHHLANKGLYNQGYGFSSSPVQMWELDHNEGWALNNWCFWTMVLEKILESPLDCKEIKPLNPKGNKLWIFIGRTDAKAEAPILWPPDAKSQLNGKDPDAGKDWGQKERRQKRMKLDTDSMDMNLSKLGEIVKDRGASCAAVHGVTKSRTWLSNWTTAATTAEECVYFLNWQ